MNEFLTNISNLLKDALSIEGDYMSYNGESREFYTFDYEFFVQTYDTIQGQLIIEVNSQNKVTLQDNVELIRQAIHDYTYSTNSSTSNFYLSSINDLSRLETFDYARQIIFEFNLNL